MTTVIQNIVTSPAASSIEFRLFDTKKRTPEGRSLFVALLTRLSLWWNWVVEVRNHGRVVHIHTCSGLSFFLDAAYAHLARACRVPVLLHVHGARFDEFLDGLPMPLKVVAHWTARACTRVIVLSEDWRARLHVRWPRARFVVVENGVRVHPEPEFKLRPGPLEVLFLGNLGARKGVWDLLQAARSSAGRWRLVLVGGDEDPGASERVDEYVRAQQLTEAVLRIGPVHGDDKYKWLRRADVFVLPSRAEGLPVAMLEAMAACLPVIVTPVGAVPSIIEDGVSGIIVPVGAVDALEHAIERLVADAGLRRRLGSAGRRICESRYGIDAIVERLVDLYREVAFSNLAQSSSALNTTPR